MEVMSLNDSTGLIFNCLFKGAVDFLMKPLRRNELKNLWRHVWRRYHCPYGSWSEFGKQVQKSVKSKGNEDFDDANTYSSEEDDSWSFALRGGCAYGSDNQDNGSISRHLGLSSFARYNTPSNSNESHCGNMESDFPHDKSSEVVKDSLVNFLSPSNARSPNPCSDGVADSFSIAAMGKDLKIGISRHLDLQIDHPVEVPIALVGSKQNIFSEIESNNFSEPRDKGKGDNSSRNVKERTANQMCVIPNTAVAYTDSREFRIRVDPSRYQKSVLKLLVMQKN